MKKELTHDFGGEYQNQLEVAILEILKNSLYLPLVSDYIPQPYCESGTYPEVQCKICDQTAPSPRQVVHVESEEACRIEYEKIDLTTHNCKWPSGIRRARRKEFSIPCRYCRSTIQVQPRETY